jgi:YTH domain-containing family protein
MYLIRLILAYWALKNSQVKVEQGLEMLTIFKDHASKTCILDDFLFYENRQKLMQEKKAKQQFQNQVL